MTSSVTSRTTNRTTIGTARAKDRAGSRPGRARYAPGGKRRRERRVWWVRVGDERGDVTATVITFGLASTMLFFVIQVALLFHARSVVSAAAQDAVRAAQVENATTADAQTAAAQILAGSDALLDDPAVVVTTNGEFVTVTITAEVAPLVFALDGPVTATASGLVERFRPQADR